jgi:hypothetical protein
MLRQFDKAIQDYNAALRVNPRLAVSLYGRGISKMKLGDAKGQADIESAKKIDATISDRMAGAGFLP